MNISKALVSVPSTRAYLERSPGVELAVLHAHPDGGLTFLVRMQKGARAEHHGHPGGEETYVLSGRLRIDRRVDAQGTPLPDLVAEAEGYVFVPPGETHSGIAEQEETLFLVVAAGGVTSAKERLA